MEWVCKYGSQLLNNFAEKERHYFFMILEMTLMHLMKHHMIRTYSLIIIFLCLLYVVSPFDVIPDVIPFLGWIDDGYVIRRAYIQLNDEINLYKTWRENNKIWVEKTVEDAWKLPTKVINKISGKSPT